MRWKRLIIKGLIVIAINTGIILQTLHQVGPPPEPQWKMYLIAIGGLLAFGIPAGIVLVNIIEYAFIELKRY